MDLADADSIGVCAGERQGGRCRNSAAGKRQSGGVAADHPAFHHAALERPDGDPCRLRRCGKAGPDVPESLASAVPKPDRRRGVERGFHESVRQFAGPWKCGNARRDRGGQAAVRIGTERPAGAGHAAGAGQRRRPAHPHHGDDPAPCRRREKSWGYLGDDAAHQRGDDGCGGSDDAADSGRRRCA